jgi:hypothetical protein
LGWTVVGAGSCGKDKRWAWTVKTVTVVTTKTVVFSKGKTVESVER